VMRDVTLRRGAYQDSVTLMQVSRELSSRPDVSNVQVAMATELNLDLLGQMGFDVPGDASPSACGPIQHRGHSSQSPAWTRAAQIPLAQTTAEPARMATGRVSIGWCRCAATTDARALPMTP